MSHICQECGKPFLSRNPKAKNCSRECALKARLSKPRKNIKVCSYCGVTYNGKKHSNCCSSACVTAKSIKPRGNCAYCGVLISRAKRKNAHAKFCSDVCQSLSTKPSPRSCINCGVEFSPIPTLRKSGHFTTYQSMKTCSEKCRREFVSKDTERHKARGAKLSGRAHPNWQGGKTIINNAVHRGKGWHQLAEKVRNRESRECKICGKTERENGRRLDVHHIVPYHDVNDTKKANRMSNLVALCRVCHRTEEHKLSMQQMVLPFAKVATKERREARSAAIPVDRPP